MKFSVSLSWFYTSLFQTAQKETNWITLTLGIVLLLGFLGFLIWLYTKGTLLQWVRAGTQTGKWKLRDVQILNETKKYERTKQIQIEELGQKAWKARVNDPSYAQAWSDLEASDSQIDSVLRYTRGLQDNLNLVHTQIDDLVRNYDNQIIQIDNQRKETDQKLKKAQSELRQLESELDKLANEKGLLQRDIKATRTDLINTEGSDEPDRVEIMNSLNLRLDGLVHNLLEVSNAEPELAGLIPARQSEVLALNTRVNELLDRVRKLENQKRNDVEPLDQQVEALEKQIKVKNDEVAELEKRMDPMIRSLGQMVDAARPSAEVLQADYANLDSTYQKLTTAAQARSDLAVKLEELDKDASRNFYLLIVLGVIVIVLAILLIAGVF